MRPCPSSTHIIHGCTMTEQAPNDLLPYYLPDLSPSIHLLTLLCHTGLSIVPPTQQEHTPASGPLHLLLLLPKMLFPIYPYDSLPQVSAQMSLCQRRLPFLHKIAYYHLLSTLHPAALLGVSSEQLWLLTRVCAYLFVFFSTISIDQNVSSMKAGVFICFVHCYIPRA